MKVQILLLPIFVLISSMASAAELRIFGVGSWFFADQMNDELRTLDLKEIKFAPGWGVDFTVQLGGRFHLGVRGMFRRMHLGDGSGAKSLQGDTYYSLLSMESGGPVLRWYLIDGQYFRFDVFGGGTYVHGALEAHSSSGLYRWETSRDDYRFGSIAGGSISLGNEQAFIVIEGGYEWHYVTELRTSANVNPGAVNNLDLKGAFATIGFGFRPGPADSSGRSPASSSSGEKGIFSRLIEKLFDDRGRK